jgi:hypothetical protein
MGPAEIWRFPPVLCGRKSLALRARDFCSHVRSVIVSGCSAASGFVEDGVRLAAPVHAGRGGCRGSSPPCGVDPRLKHHSLGARDRKRRQAKVNSSFSHAGESRNSRRGVETFSGQNGGCVGSVTFQDRLSDRGQTLDRGRPVPSRRRCVGSVTFLPQHGPILRAEEEIPRLFYSPKTTNYSRGSSADAAH